MMRIVAAGCFATATLVLLAGLDQPRVPDTEKVRLAKAADEVEIALFTALRNAEIDASVWNYERVRRAEFIADRNAEIERSIAAYDAHRMQDFADARNAEIEASSGKVAALALAAFAKARNSEIDASLQRVASAKLADFAVARNTEIDKSEFLVRDTVAFARERNKEIDFAEAASRAQRELEFRSARNAEIDTSIANYQANRLAEFAAARNSEIEISLAAYDIRRAMVASGDRGLGETAPLAAIETGSLSDDHAPTPGAAACQAMAEAIAPVEIKGTGAKLSAHDKEALDELAQIAKTCAETVIEIRGIKGVRSAGAQASQKRMRMIASYLAGAGVDAHRFNQVTQAQARKDAQSVTGRKRTGSISIALTLKSQNLAP